MQEVETLKNLVLDSTKHDILLKQKDTTTKVYTENRKIENDTTIVEFSKTDITGDKELVGAKLTVLDENDNIIDSWISSENTHKIEGLEVAKKYKLREEIAVETFVKATDVEFTVENTNEIQKVTMVDKVVEMTKVDIAGEEVVGAKMQVLDMEGNIIDEWISGKEPHKISGLEENHDYILHEESAVDTFVKATDIPFRVTEDKETQKLTMIDKRVAVKKTDLVTGEELEGAELEVTDKDGNVIDSWTSTKEEHYVTGLVEGETYQLSEKTCPYGFEVAESIEFTVSEDKETQLIEMKDMPILTSIQVVKVDSKTKEQIKDGFTFGIYEDEECTKLIKEVEGKEAIALFEDLRYRKIFYKGIKSTKFLYAIR